MTILTELPKTFKEYKQFFHDRSRLDYPIIKKEDMINILSELRLAYQQYPDNRNSIMLTAKVIKLAIQKCKSEELNNSLTKIVNEALGF